VLFCDSHWQIRPTVKGSGIWYEWSSARWSFRSNTRFLWTLMSNEFGWILRVELCSMLISCHHICIVLMSCYCLQRFPLCYHVSYLCTDSGVLCSFSECSFTVLSATWQEVMMLSFRLLISLALVRQDVWQTVSIAFTCARMFDLFEGWLHAKFYPIGATCRPYGAKNLICPWIIWILAFAVYIGFYLLPVGNKMSWPKL